MRVECRRRGLWLWQCHHCLTLKWALPSPGSAFGVGAPARRWGACLAAGAYQTTGKCQCLRGHLSSAPNSQPPSACHRRARRCSTAQGRGACLGGADAFHFAFVCPIFLVAPGALVLPGVWKVCRLLSARLLVGNCGGERCVCRQPVHSSLVCLAMDSCPPRAAVLSFSSLIVGV